MIKIRLTTAGKHPQLAVTIPEAVLIESEKKWNAAYKGKPVPGMLGTPGNMPLTVNLTEISHMTHEIYYDRSIRTLVARVEIINTPRGQILQSIWRDYIRTKELYAERTILSNNTKHPSSGEILSIDMQRVDFMITNRPYRYLWDTNSTSLSQIYDTAMKGI